MSHALSRCYVALLAGVLLFAHVESGAAQLAKSGIVVEEVGKGSAGEKANIQPGDILLAWERPANPPANPEKAAGRIESVFDWIWVEMEQGPLGIIQVRGERDGKEVTFGIPVGSWGIKVRPRFDGEALKGYEQGKSAVNAKELEKGTALWDTVAKSAEAAGDLLRACWMNLRIGATWAEVRRWQEAKAVYELARELAERAMSVVAQSLAWDAIGQAHERQNVFQEAEKAYESAKMLREKAWGESLSVTKSLSDLGLLAQQKGDLATAEAYHERALSIGQKLAPDSLAVADSLTGLGVVRRNRGDLATAETYFKRALAIKQRFVPDSRTVAGSLNNLGSVAYNRDDLAAADAYYQSALRIEEKLAPDSLLVAGYLNNLGLVAGARDDLATAEAYHTRSLTIREKLAPGSLSVAATLGNLGIVARRRGDLATAEAYHKRELAIGQKLAPESLAVAASLNTLGNVAHGRGDLATAEVYFRRALAIQEKKAPDSITMATCLNSMGLVANSRGDLTTAEAYFKRALAIQEKKAPDGVFLSSYLNNLGNVAYNRGDLSTAETYFKRGLAIREKVAPDGLHVASSLSNLGAVARDRGDLESAETFHRHALELEEKLAPGSLSVAATLGNLGLIARDRGDLAAAEAHHKRALAIGEKLAPGSAFVAEVLHDLGISYRKGNQISLAADHIGRAIEALETQAGKLGGTQEAQTGYGAQHTDYYRDYIDVLMHLNQPVEAFQILERSRARTLLTMLAERDLVFAADLPEEIERERKRLAWEYDQAQAKLTRLNPAKDQSQPEPLINRLRELRDRQSEIVQEIRQKSPRLASLQYTRPLDFKGVQAAVDPGTVVLSYSIAKEKSYLFVLTGGAGIETHTLTAGEAQLREEVEKFRSLIQRVQWGSKDDLTDIAERGKRLYETLIQPASKTIEKADRVLVLPDGPLHVLPFAALVRGGLKDSKRNWQYLVEWKPLHVVVSATVYAELRKQRQNREKKETGKTLMAFGNPKYPSLGAEQDEKDRQDPVLRSIHTRGGLTPLPATGREIAVIAELYGERAGIYVGEAATEEQARSVPKETKYLHFACHGVIDERSPLNSGLALTIPAEIREGQENGILQAWEIFERVRVDADLVTLSACETALGKEMGGEGLVGLTRAFQYAGARSVLASLWSVADETTADLMKRFYGYLKSGQTKDKALRQAQLDLIRGSVSIQDQKGGARKLDTSHPFYWAAFQLNGDWR